MALSQKGETYKKGDKFTKESTTERGPAGDSSTDWTQPSIYNKMHGYYKNQTKEGVHPGSQKGASKAEHLALKQMRTMLETSFIPGGERKNRKTGKIEKTNPDISDQFLDALADYENVASTEQKQRGMKHALYNKQPGAGHVGGRMKSVNSTMDAKNDEAVGNSGLLG